MVDVPNMGDQVWLITSKHTLPLLPPDSSSALHSLVQGVDKDTHVSSMLGWKILFINPILGDLYGNCSGSSTWIFQTPLANGAVKRRSFGQLRIRIAAIRGEVARASLMRAWANSFPRHIVIPTQEWKRERRDSLSVGPLNLTKNSDILLLTNVTS